MERLEIQVFLTLAKELHFGRTAERLFISRARVSQSVQKLERAIGAPLFERTSRRVRLTPLGQQLYEDIEPGYRLIKAGVARAEAAARGVDGVLRIGFLGAAAGEFVLDAIGAFTARYPGTDAQIKETQINSIITPLRAGDVDVLVTQFPIDEQDLTSGPVVFSVPRMIAVPRRHPLAERTSASLEDLAYNKVFACIGEVPMYWQEHNTPLRTPSGRPIERGESASTLQETLALVGAGKGISPVGADVAQHYTPRGVIYVPLEDVEPLEYGLVWRTAGENARVRGFVRACMDTATAKQA
ncbi:DNA-binding transcriptional LysR family regulator [Nocardiopsis mwathae]|uniref:DNA-binding transcriptional LysR family regulator n=1 Tax=Nocardiopsis mwathae TaxID=1472723 RepID=A0A7X0D7E6_9ACTN|nr:DNA-binding transcriptional LysR family regulator [Nocardiopsis mwathae]